MADAQTEISAAHRYDAAGRHDDAINALARATKLGSVEAARRLGKRLVTGFNAPRLPREGVRFLIDAHRAGDAEAAARLATLSAVGFVVDRDLQGALQLLGIAAARGWRAARQQLEALIAGERPDSGLRDVEASPPGDHSNRMASGPSAQTDVCPPDGTDWLRRAASVDVSRWIEASPGRTLHDDPTVRVFDQLIPKGVCEWLIRGARARLQRALVYDPVGGRDFADHSRTNSVAQFDLMNTELLHLLVQLKMSAATGIPLEQFEATAILHYDPGEEITAHFDFVNPSIPNYTDEVMRNGQRIATFLVYLNDDYLGGETAFPKLGISHRGERGQGLMFSNALGNGQPDLRTLHAGCPPSSGEKWIVSQFIRNRPVLNTGGG